MAAFGRPPGPGPGDDGEDGRSLSLRPGPGGATVAGTTGTMQARRPAGPRPPATATGIGWQLAN